MPDLGDNFYIIWSRLLRESSGLRCCSYLQIPDHWDLDYLASKELAYSQSVVWLNRCLETSATCFDCCLSQEILDGGN